MPLHDTRGAASAFGFGFGKFDEPGIYPFTSFTFETTNLRGYIGPTRTQCLAYYNTTTYPWLTDTSFFNVLTSGIQVWTVPKTGGYKITAQAPNGLGDSGFLAGGGTGATMAVGITLTVGEKLYILCGQPGASLGIASSAAGCGGTFVVRVQTGYISNPQAGLSSTSLTEVICVAGAGSRFNPGYTFGSHPSGVNNENGATRVIGGGRGTAPSQQGPNGASGMFYPNFVTNNNSDNSFDKTWNPYDSPASYSNSTVGFAFGLAYPFVQGGYGSYGVNSTTYTATLSGGFGGGGGQFTGNGYSSGSGGFIGGYETFSSSGSFNGRTYATNGATCGGGGGSYINASAAGYIQTYTNSNSISVIVVILF